MEILFVYLRINNGYVSNIDALERVVALTVTDEKNVCLDNNESYRAVAHKQADKMLSVY